MARSHWLGIAALAGCLSSPAVSQRAAAFSKTTQAFVIADQPTILVKDARLLDVIHGKAVEREDMLVREGRIVEIGEHLTAPAGAKVIEAGGKTLIPGLITMHEHLTASAPVGERMMFFSNPYEPQVLLAYGTTTARTAGGFDLEGDLYLKQQVEAGKIPGADLDVSVYIEGPKNPIATLPAIADAAAARREVAYWADRGATSVKLFFDATPDVVAGAIAEAKARHMSVAGHLCATHAATAARLGMNTLEHSMLAAYDLLPGADEKSCPKTERQTGMLHQMATLDPHGPEVGKLLKTLLQYKVAIDPTLAVRQQYLCSPITPPPSRERALLAKPDVFEPPASCAHFGINADMEKRGIAFQTATAVRYHRMGGALLVGTDQWLVPGAGAPAEMQTLVEAGLSPLEVIQAATINGARALGRDKEIGSLEVGKRADFLLVDGKPDRNISDIRKLTAVFKNGIGYDPQKLYDDAKGKIVS